jgi:hypothetical protein
MAKPIRSQEAAQAISEEQWVPVLAQFTRENRGAHARLEVIGVDEIGYAVETEDRPFDGVSADTKDRERAVWFAFGTTPGHLTHGVQNVTAVRMLPPTGQSGAALEVVAKVGSRTVLTLTRPEEFELPPARS